jgi:hypothetical protein
MVTLKVPGEFRLTAAVDGKGIDPRRADSGLGGRLVEGLCPSAQRPGRAGNQQPGYDRTTDFTVACGLSLNRPRVAEASVRLQSEERIAQQRRWRRTDLSETPREK